MTDSDYSASFYEIFFNPEWQLLLFIFRKKAPTPKPEEPEEPVKKTDDDGGDKEEPEEEEEEEEEEPPKIEVGFDLNDLLNKIPFMYPGKEPCTWRYQIT